MNKNLIAITIGDIKGIGIEILISLWKSKKINNFILVSNKEFFINYLNKKKINIKIKIINKYSNIKKINKKDFIIYDYKSKNVIENSYLSLFYAYNLCINNHCKAILTLPINKKNIAKKIDKKFIGQTEYFQSLNKKKISNMIFYSNKLITTPLTTHIPINKINNFLSKKNYIYKKIKSLEKILKKDFKIKKPKMLLLGINPHAGENGIFGNEENKYYLPLLKKIKKDKILVDGPIPADSAFNAKNLKFYDCFITSYHDQALIPFKIISGFKGLNYTGNLDVIRVSPNHGTAYDLVGTKNINKESVLYCFNIIKKIIKNRK